MLARMVGSLHSFVAFGLLLGTLELLLASNYSTILKEVMDLDWIN
jgi:hypothetical protein